MERTNKIKGLALILTAAVAVNMGCASKPITETENVRVYEKGDDVVYEIETEIPLPDDRECYSP